MTTTPRGPHDSHDGFCMKCDVREPYVLVSRLANALTLWLCLDCQKQLNRLVYEWLPLEDRPNIFPGDLPP